MPVVFTLNLSDDGSPLESKKFVRLPPPVSSSPFILRFQCLAGAMASQHGFLCTNYPPKNEEFDRLTFYKNVFTGNGLDDFICDIEIQRPGIYEYFVEFDDSETGVKQSSSQRGHFLVDPRLYVPQGNLLDPCYSLSQKCLLPLDAITLITVIPKWMPTLSKWMPYFNSFANTGYNMIHFAPVNQRGSSNSPYSIYDQLSISDDLFDQKLSQEEKISEFIDVIHQIYETCGMLSATDVVWNHTACNSLWLQDHPEAGYNLVNSPHLRAANELDEEILLFSDAISQKYGRNPSMQTEEELDAIMQLFKESSIPRLKLWEFYIVNVKGQLEEFKTKWTDGPLETNRYKNINLGGLSLYEQANALSKDALFITNEGCRFAKAIHTEIGMEFIKKLLPDMNKNNSIQEALIEYEKILNEINLTFYKEYDADMAAILENITNRARYLRVSEHGPRLGAIGRGDPLVDSYFTRLPLNERTAHRHSDELILANNGWIWNADPLVNFASKKSKAYLRRDVIAWGDCVKLNYGDKPQDNPWLWEHQANYTKLMARMFHGFRIDNCHSTPMHVASYFLDIARSVNPDLYVFAELFTGSEEKDILFVSQLGINSLIREAMNAWDTHELSRQVHRQGGNPLGSFILSPERFPLDILGHSISPCYFKKMDEDDFVLVDLKGSVPHSLFMDCTHDNETPHQKRTAEDTLPNAAIVAMSDCAIGSVKGYDELVPELLNLVSETRKYRVPEMFEGIIPAKSVLYELHSKLAKEGYHEIHVHQEADFISIHRVHPITHDGYLLIARTAYRDAHDTNVHSPISLRNQGVQLIESASLKVDTHGHTGHAKMPYGSTDLLIEETENDELIPPQSPTLFYHPFSFDTHMHEQKNGTTMKQQQFGCITGFPCTLTFSTNLTNLCHVKELKLNENDVQSIISVDPTHFKPGSIVVYRTWVIGSGLEETEDPESLGGSVQDLNITIPVSPINNKATQKGNLDLLWEYLGHHDRNIGVEFMCHLSMDVLYDQALWFCKDSRKWPIDLKEAVSDLGLEEINVIMYRTETEERDMIDEGVYDIPGYGKLAYGGLQGFITVMSALARNNDTGHPLCNNLRQGFWMLDYISFRLQKYAGTFPKLQKIIKWLNDRFVLLRTLSTSLLPKYFFATIFCLYHGIRFRSLQISNCNKNSHSPSSLDIFDESCKMVTFQMYGSVKSTGLFPREYPMELKFMTRIQNPFFGARLASLAAGLPHFSTHHMRCWGRDVFISIRGLLLIPGHFDEARTHLIAFGSALKHGLIPNLLDQGIRPRYNARDATWFWLFAVSEYCRLSPEGYGFLNALVARRFVPLRRYTHGIHYGQDYEESQENPEADHYIDPEHSLVYTYYNTIAELCHEILDRHSRGIQFREWNAGPFLDHAMSSKGFDIEIGTHWEDGTGFVYGGNEFNCGTWMDKMGDSVKASNKGIPATPRDGSPIEIIGLQWAVLNWITTDILNSNLKCWPSPCVGYTLNGTHQSILYSDWNAMLMQNFEKFFYIPHDEANDKDHVINPKLIHQRGIYKDTLGSRQPFTEYQLRPNQCIAMVVAPELFQMDHLERALKMIKKFLVGPLGIKTLDPTDWAYRGDYDNSNDSEDATIAHGFNYHQGPEWLWIYAMFLRAYLGYHKRKQDAKQLKSAIFMIQRMLEKHKKEIQMNEFHGLPELTNSNGTFCYGSCPTQAWSSAVMIELISELSLA